MKRQRGRGRKPGGNTGNRSHESNGPDVKIRGTAAQIYEKYMQYARDAQTSGDRVRYENLLQHAEHYYRIMAANMPKDRLPGQQNANGNEGRDNDEANSDAGSNDDTSNDSENESSDRNEEAAASSSDDQNEGQERPARRPRRPRRRNNENGEKSEADNSGGGDKEAKSALDKLAHKQAAVAGD